MSTGVRPEMVLLTLCFSFMLPLGLRACHELHLSMNEHSAPAWPDVDRQKAAVNELNNYSEYSGWEATFSYEWRTLRMEGSMLCDKEFVMLIPPAAAKLVLDNFVWFRCEYKGTHLVYLLGEKGEEADAASRAARD